MRATILACLVLFAFSAIVMSQSTRPNTASNPATRKADPPNISDIRDAKRKFDFTVQQSHDVYVKSIVDADQTYIDALTKAEDAAMKEGLPGKAEADKIDAARLAAIGRLNADKAELLALSVIKAKWGVEGTNDWMDVTSRIQVANNGEITFDSSRFGVFADGKIKTLMADLNIGPSAVKIAIHETSGPGMSTVKISAAGN